MHFKSLALVASLAASAMAAEINIMVGMNGTKTFSPTPVNASIGDIINFVFVAGNHSVRQSTFADPCTLKSGGFTNDFQPIKANAGPFPTIQLAVNTTAPIWFYCPQTVNVSHCHAGMVGAINPTAQMTFETFQKTALALGNTTAASGNTTTGATTGTTSSSGASSNPTPTTPTTSNGGGNSSSSNNNTSGGVAQLRPSMLLTGSSVALLGVVASAMLTL